MEIYLQLQLNCTIQSNRMSDVVTIPAPVETMEETEMIVKAIRKVYKSDRGLDRAWRRREGEDKEMSGILRYAIKLREGADSRWKYEVLSVLLGSRTSPHVYEVLDKELIADNDWESQIFRGMCSQISDF